MKKTPLQQLIEYMGQNQYFIGNDLYAKQKELLQEEKQMVVYAYYDGMNAEEIDNGEVGIIFSEQYFNDKFGQ